MFTQLKETVKNVTVNFGQGYQKNKSIRVPATITSNAEGITSGWSLNYELGTSRDGGLFNIEGVHSVSIPNFSKIGSYLVAAYQKFLSGEDVVKYQKITRSIYEIEEDKIRLTVTSRRNSAYVTLTVLDQDSPFYLLTVPFVLGPDKQNPGNIYILGTAKYYNQQEDTFLNLNAYLSPEKRRVLTVDYNFNDRSNYIKANLKVNNQNQIVSNQNGVAVDGGDYQYMQQINSKYKAASMLIEFELIDYVESVYRQSKNSQVI